MCINMISCAVECSDQLLSAACAQAIFSRLIYNHGAPPSLCIRQATHPAGNTLSTKTIHHACLNNPSGAAPAEMAKMYETAYRPIARDICCDFSLVLSNIVRIEPGNKR